MLFCFGHLPLLLDRDDDALVGIVL